MPTAARTGPARQEARRLGTIASLMAATLDLLVERGYGGLTMAGVAGRADRAGTGLRIPADDPRLSHRF
ncbi:hypothetical protein GCM10011505_43520 [Tistrella bauzanensis]|uniref:HTH tetR-type domain-containing protein n=1 Tax=Tistrella bauzanensis TaxID=657419 RepID=A0ABQ1J1N5_9PROT|nr:hypothetical protein [Tistrella bauzanensis]GGB57928.1 hypothetical protein GCM10011505_43520 [Tistrella bauzanensis]